MRTRRGGRLAAEGRGAGGVHSGGVSGEQRAARGAVLILAGSLLAGIPLAGQTFDFDPSLTQQEFDELTLLAGEALFASPVDAPASTGLFHFEIGVAATAIEVDEQASFWIKSVSDDILVDGRLLVPRLVASKGLGFANVAVSYGRVGDSEAHVLGGSVDLPLVRGGLARPAIALRGVYSDLRNVDEASLRSWGALVMVGKGFGPLTPYAGWGRMFAEGEARIELTGLDPIVLESEVERDLLVVGAKLDLALIKLVVEGTEGTEWRYAARVAIGF